MQIRADVDHDAEEHAALGLLLRQDRAEPKRSAVRRVLAHPLTIAQKIEAIREIDGKEDAAGVLRVVHAAAAEVAHDHARRISRVIKNEVATRTFLGFLLTDFNRVRKFGRRTYVLAVRIFPPSIRVDPRLEEFLTTTIRSIANNLSESLGGVAAHGWTVLTPRQYNLLTLLKRLADHVRAFDSTQVNFHRGKAVEALERIESWFLMLHYDLRTMDCIFEALRAYNDHHHVSPEDSARLLGLVLQFLTQDCTVPSLYNAILGLNMLKSRRFLTLANLMRSGLGEVVDVERFDFDPAVRGRVEKRIDDTLESIKMLYEQLQEVKLSNSFVPAGGGGRRDTTALKAVYEFSSEKSSMSFAADQDNLVLFVFRLLRSFDRVFAPLLHGQCVVESQGRVQLFSPSFFALDFTKLRTLADKLELEMFRYSRFPLSRYLQIRDGRIQAIGTEAEVSEHIAQGTMCLADLGRTIIKVVSLRSPPKSPDQAPLEPFILHGKAFSIPHESGTLVARSPLNGLVVLQALRLVATVTFSAGILLHDDFVSMFYAREKRLEADFTRGMKSLQTMLDPESYRELAALYE